MALDFNKIEEPDDSVFPVKLENNSNLDMYGVWVKKRPENEEAHKNDILPTENDSAEDPFEGDVLEFDDHDIMDLDNSDTSFEFEPLDTNDSFEDISDISEANDILEDDDIFGSDFDIFDEPDAVLVDDEDIGKDSVNEMNIEDNLENQEIEETSDTNEFENLDLDDFFTDEETKEDDAIDLKKNDDVEISEQEFDISSTLSNDKAESSEIENFSEVTIDDISDFDKIMDDLESNEEDKTHEVSEEEEIPLSITIDEDSDISSLAGKAMGDDELEDVAIFTEVPEFKTSEKPIKQEEKEDDSLIIESTIIEAGNIEEIKKENQKIMNNETSENDVENKKEDASDDFDAMLDNIMGEEPSEKSNVEASKESDEEDSDIFFDDVGALENDLLDENLLLESEEPHVQEEQAVDIQAKSELDLPIQESEPEPKLEPKTQIASAEPSAPAQSTVFANDKATEILIQIASELSNIKNELATLKLEMAQPNQKEETKAAEPEETPVTQTILNEVTESDESGFFNDDDGDETIALTGDELNNILITADFIEENTEKDYEIPETLDNINEEFLADESTDEAFSDHDLLTAVQPEHINPLTDDVSYLDENESDTQNDEDLFEGYDLEESSIGESNLELEESPIDEPNLELDTSALDESNSEIGETDFDDFDLTITELELPDGQSIPLGDEYSNFEAITENVQEGHDEADFDDADFDDNINLDDETLDGVNFEEKIPEDIPQEIEADEDISEKIIIEDMDQHSDAPEEDKLSEVPVDEFEEAEVADEVFSHEELDQAAQDIPRLDLPENAAEEQKVKSETLPIHLKDEIKSVLTYMDQLLESLPEDKIEEFAKSEYFDTYKRLFDELGIS